MFGQNEMDERKGERKEKTKQTHVTNIIFHTTCRTHCALYLYIIVSKSLEFIYSIYHVLFFIECARTRRPFYVTQ